MAEPIWKDHFSNLGAYASRYFRIRVGTTTIYSGRAYRAAASGNLYVRINDICADYMAQVPAAVPLANQSRVSFPISFTVQQSSNGTSWSTVETVSFNDDWSYDLTFDPSTAGMSFPITGRIDPRMVLFQTRYASGAVTATLRYGTTTATQSAAMIPSTSADSFRNALNHAGAGAVTLNLAHYATSGGKALTSVTIGLTTYNVAKGCARFAVYYKNPFGGYDHLLIEGGATRARSVQRGEFVADYDNRTTEIREGWTFENEITESWTLNTGLLTLEESARMPYLLDSPDVFFCDLENPSVFIPVTIATDSYNVESYNVKGSRMKNFSFQVRVSQNTYRR